VPAAAKEATHATTTLQPSAGVGADLLSAYQLLTLISGLYAQAGAFDQQPRSAPLWSELTDRIIGDLGELYAAWDASLKRAADQPNSPRHAKLATGIRRAEALSRHLNVWTPSLRWATALRRLEVVWQRRLGDLLEVHAQDEHVAPRLSRALQASLARESRLALQIGQMRAERDRLQTCYRLSDPLAGKKAP
jgi:hypothetical protein